MYLLNLSIIAAAAPPIHVNIIYLIIAAFSFLLISALVYSLLSGKSKKGDNPKESNGAVNDHNWKKIIYLDDKYWIH